MRSTTTRLKSLWLGCLLVAIACAPAWADNSGEITGVKLDPEKKSLVISTKGVMGKHQARVIGSPNRLIIDFAGTAVGNTPRKIAGGRDDISEIRLGHSVAGARVVVDFKDKPVPGYKLSRENNQVQVIFGSSLAGDLPAGKSDAPDGLAKNSGSHLAPSFVPAAANASANPAHSGGGTIPARVRAPAAPGDPNAPGKGLLVAQSMMNRPPSSMQDRPSRPGPPPRGIPAQEKQVDSPAGPGNTRMVREVRPPVTPPTPDPRLLVQEITELRFIQVGHNARLIVRGGDGLDYRLNKVSPTKLRIDLINAEIPKVHQKPLKTDLFSTSVELIIPGSQTIFVQLKDAVTYQVEKKKGVLMVDFPPPRFTMVHSREGAGGVPGGGGAEGSRIIREEQIRKQVDLFNKDIERLQKEREQLLKQRTEILKKYQVSPDPEVFNKPVTMDFQGISLKNAFRLLAEQAGINIIVGDGVTGATTLRLFDVPLGQVIDTIINTHNLDREMIGNVMRVDSKTAMKTLKEERRKEYVARVEEVDIRLDNDPANIPKDDKAAEKKKKSGLGVRQQIDKLQRQIETNMEELKKLQEAPVEDTRTEEIGEAGCITVDGEKVCFNYATVRLSYAKPTDIVRTLRCLFNLDCPGTGTGGQQEVFVGQEQESGVMRGLVGGQIAGATAMTDYSRQLQDQGFTPDSPGYRARMQTQAGVQAQVQSAQAQGAAATAIAASGAKRAGVTIKTAFGEDPRLAKIVAYSTLWADEVNRMIFIKDTPDRIAQMKKLIFTLDVPDPQVLIESRLVVADREWSRGLGILWGGTQTQSGTLTNNRKALWGATGATTGPTSAITATSPPAPEIDIPSLGYVVNLPTSVTTILGAGLSFGFLAGNYATELDLRLQIGESANKTKVIARPKVQVLNQQSAIIKRGFKIPYQTQSLEGTQTQFVDADLSLRVTPTIYSDGRIRMRVEVKDDEPTAVAGIDVPAIRQRQAQTVLMVKDSDTAVIGGILRDSNSNSRAGWPGLMNVPVIGNLFSNKTSSTNTSELLVFITPTIIRRPPPAS